MKKLEEKIEYLFYLFVFLLPWQTRLIWHDAWLNGSVLEYGRFSLYGVQLLLWLILFLYLFLILTSGRLARPDFSLIFKRLRDPAVMIYCLIIIFILLSGLTIIWSLDPDLAYYRWFVLVQAGAMMAMILKLGFSLEKLALAWVGSAAIQGAFAIWQFFVQYVPANKWFGLAMHLSTVPGSIILQTDIERWLRAYGSLPHPNILAGFLVIAVMFLLYLAFIAEGRGRRIFVLTCLLFMIPSLFFTFSRSAWIALAFCLAALGFWLLKKREYLWNRTFLKIFLLISLIVIILGINLRGPLITRMRGEQDLEAASINLRITFVQQAAVLVADSPWVGTGIGNYTLGVFKKIDSTWPGYYYQPVHNIYLLVLAETGIFGAIVFGLILILIILFSLRNSASAAPASRLQEIILLLSLLSILIISLFDHYFWTLEFGVLVFWLILGLNLKSFKRS